MDKNIYIKEGGRYVPIGTYLSLRHDWFTEGVWVVCKNEQIKGSYLKSQFKIEKASDLQEVSYAELGGIHKLAREILSRMGVSAGIGIQPTEIVHTTLKILKDIQNESKQHCRSGE